MRQRRIAYGERNGNAILTRAKVNRAKRLRRLGDYWTSIAATLGCNESTVRRACKGQTWRVA